MKKFSSFLTEKKAALDYETYITVAFNGSDDKALAASNLTADQYDKNKDNAEKIAKAIKAKTKGKKLTHIGSAQGKTVNWWEGSPTPKTDVLTDNGVHISLKTTNTGSQLTSGGSGEARSIFKAALKHSHDAEAEKLAKMVLGSMKTFLIPAAKRGKVTINQFTTKVKAGKKQGNKELNDMAKEFLEADKMRKEVTKMTNKYFEKNAEFRKWFVYEAATGAVKFSPEGRNGPSIANWVVKFNSDNGDVALVEPLSKGGKPTKMIDSLASKVRFRVSWKTPHGTGPSTYLALRADILESHGIESNLWEMIDTELNTLNENVINNIKDFFKNLWKKVTVAISKAAKKGYEYLLAYLGFDVNKLNVKVAGLEY